MSQYRMIACGLLLFALISGCAYRPTPSNRAEDESQIQKLEDSVSQALEAKNLDQLISLYAEDAALYDDRNPSIRGKNSIRETWKAAFSHPGISMSTRPQTVEVSSDGNMAWAHGAFRIERQVSPARPATDRWDYTMIYMQQTTGQWKIMADSAYCGLRSRLNPGPSEVRSPAGAFAPLIGLACVACALWFMAGMPVVVVVQAWKSVRKGRMSAGLLVSAVMLAVFFLTAILLWNYIAGHEWNLPFMHMVKATTDTVRYGNPVEDTAEDVLIALLVLSPLSAVAAGIVTWAARWAWLRRKQSV